MTLEPFFRWIPLALPGTILCAVLCALCAPRMARRWDVRPSLAWLYATALGGFAALTATPSGAALEGYQQGTTGVSLSVRPPTLAELGSVDDVSLNVAVGVVLGIAGCLLAAARRTSAPWLPVLVAPCVTELVQWAFPQLGRSGFLLTDVVHIWLGIAVGAVLTWVALRVVRG